MNRIKLGLVRLAPPCWPAPPRGAGYVYAVRSGLLQLVNAPAAEGALALHAELAR